MAVLASTWVDATPFRAHLRFLMGVGAMTPYDVAALAGISTSAAEHLLHGHAGRTVRRISPEMGRRLLAVSAADVRALPWRLVPVDKARPALQRLRSTGLSDAEIAELAGVSAVELAGLDRPVHHCSQLLSLRLSSAAEAVERTSEPRRRRHSGPLAA